MPKQLCGAQHHLQDNVNHVNDDVNHNHNFVVFSASLGALACTHLF